jgi:hypothetical protein
MEEESAEATSALSEDPAPLSFAEFLENTPPNQEVAIVDLMKKELVRTTRTGAFPAEILNTPDIQLHCPSDACNGLRFYRCMSGTTPPKEDTWQFIYLSYHCANCRRGGKTFSIAVKRDKKDSSGKCYKFGERPPFGPPAPARLISLIGPDRELFLKGLRCEDQGLGIGAFVYYRRVVENQKNRIISQILKVATKLEIDAAATAELEAAITETQFTKALESVKHGIPQSRVVNCDKPQGLVQRAVCDGVAGRSAQKCRVKSMVTTHCCCSIEL